MIELASKTIVQSTVWFENTGQTRNPTYTLVFPSIMYQHAFFGIAKTLAEAIDAETGVAKTLSSPKVRAVRLLREFAEELLDSCDWEGKPEGNTPLKLNLTCAKHLIECYMV